MVFWLEALNNLNEYFGQIAIDFVTISFLKLMKLSPYIINSDKSYKDSPHAL